MNTGTNPRGWSIHCVLEWLKIREKEGRTFPESLKEFEAEIDHSALLRRLIEGKPPLDHPPPLSHSYPWYELVDKGEAQAYEVHELSGDSGSNIYGHPVLLINGHPWHIAEKKSDMEYVVTFGESKDQYRCFAYGDANFGSPSPYKWRVAKIQ